MNIINTFYQFSDTPDFSNIIYSGFAAGAVTMIDCATPLTRVWGRAAYQNNANISSDATTLETIQAVRSFDADLKGWGPLGASSSSKLTGDLSNTPYFNVKAFGAFWDGDSHPLSDLYADLTAAQVDYPFLVSGQFPSAEIDYCALQQASNAACASTYPGHVLMPSGRGMINWPVIHTKGITTTGVGAGSEVSYGGTDLYWTGDYIRFTANSTTHKLTSVGRTFKDDERVHLMAYGGSLPTGLNNSTTYWVINTESGNKFQVSTSQGGSPVSFSSNGSGDLMFDNWGCAPFCQNRGGFVVNPGGSMIGGSIFKDFSYHGNAVLDVNGYPVRGLGQWLWMRGTELARIVNVQYYDMSWRGMIIGAIPGDASTGTGGAACKFCVYDNVHGANYGSSVFMEDVSFPVNPFGNFMQRFKESHFDGGGYQPIMSISGDNCGIHEVYCNNFNPFHGYGVEVNGPAGITGNCHALHLQASPGGLHVATYVPQYFPGTGSDVCLHGTCDISGTTLTLVTEDQSRQFDSDIRHINFYGCIIPCTFVNSTTLTLDFAVAATAQTGAEFRAYHGYFPEPGLHDARAWGHENYFQAYGHEYWVKISSIGATDKVRWMREDGSWSAEVTIQSISGTCTVTGDIVVDSSATFPTDGTIQFIRFLDELGGIGYSARIKKVIDSHTLQLYFPIVSSGRYRIPVYMPLFDPNSASDNVYISFWNDSGHRVGDQWRVRRKPDAGMMVHGYSMDNAQPPPVVDDGCTCNWTNPSSDLTQWTIETPTLRTLGYPIIDIHFKGENFSGSAAADQGIRIRSDGMGAGASLLHFYGPNGSNIINITEGSGVIFGQPPSIYTLTGGGASLHLYTKNAGEENAIVLYDGTTPKWLVEKTATGGGLNFMIQYAPSGRSDFQLSAQYGSAMFGAPTSGMPTSPGVINCKGILVDGSPVLSPGNPSASVGTSAVNGSASTFMRSDAAPAINLTMSPTWTGQHTFSGQPVTISGQDGGSFRIKSASDAVETVMQFYNQTTAKWNVGLHAADYGYEISYAPTNRLDFQLSAQYGSAVFGSPASGFSSSAGVINACGLQVHGISVPATGWKDVTAFGADRTGVFNSTSAITAALAAISSGGGGTLFYPDGTYTVDADAMFQIPSYTTIMHGRYVVINAPSTSGTPSAIYKADATHNISMIGGILQGHRSVGAYYGISLDNGAHDIRIEGVIFKNFQYDGIMGDSSYNITIRDCEFTAMKRNGLSVVDGHGYTVDSCNFHDISGSSPQSGIDLEPTPGGTPVYDIEILNSRFTDNSGAGIMTASTGVHEVLIEGNYIARNYININITAAPNTAVKNNIIASSTDSYGIQVSASDNVSIIGNLIYDNALDGIITASDPSYTVIANNTIYGNYRGVFINGASYPTIENNIVHDNLREGIYLRSNNANVAANTVYANSQAADDTYDNIYLYYDNTYAVVQGNIVNRGTGATQPQYGIEIDGPGCIGNIITNNDIESGGKSGDYLDTGTGTIFTEPFRFINNQDAQTSVRCVNNNAGTSAQAAYVCDNGTYIAGFGMNGTGFSASGYPGANVASYYTNGSSMWFIVDSGNGVIHFATGGHAEKGRLDENGNLFAIGNLISGLQAATNTPGLLKLIGAGSNSPYYTTISAGSNTGNLAITLPTAAPGAAAFLKMSTGGVMSYDTGVYLTSLAGAVLTDQTSGQTIGDTTNRLAKLWATDITCTNAVSGSVTGNAGTVTNGLYSNGSYSDPSWLTALNATKISAGTGAVAIAAGGTDQNITLTPSGSGCIILNGFLGVGITPTHPLEVSTNVAGWTYNAFFQNKSTTGKTAFQVAGNAANVNITIASLGGSVPGTFLGQTAAYLQALYANNAELWFGTGDNYNFYLGSNGVTRVTIQGDGSVGIGSAPVTSALLTLTSTLGALLVPRMSTTQKNALTPTDGMILYDLTLNKFQGYENGAWANLI